MSAPLREPAPPRLQFTADLRRTLGGWAQRGHPREACGLLLGRWNLADAAIVEAVEARNAAADPRRRFELDPADHLAAELRARALGLEVVGVWHSHPDAPACPSALDRAAAWSGWIHVIVSVSTSGVSELRAWRLGTGEPIELELGESQAP
jgi:proteasome lid subunit RPN8/RPN11